MMKRRKKKFNLKIRKLLNPKLRKKLMGAVKRNWKPRKKKR